MSGWHAHPNPRPSQSPHHYPHFLSLNSFCELYSDHRLVERLIASPNCLPPGFTIVFSAQKSAQHRQLSKEFVDGQPSEGHFGTHKLENLQPSRFAVRSAFASIVQPDFATRLYSSIIQRSS